MPSPGLGCGIATKGLAKPAGWTTLRTARAMAEAKCVDADPSECRGRLLPDDGAQDTAGARGGKPPFPTAGVQFDLQQAVAGVAPSLRRRHLRRLRGGGHRGAARRTSIRREEEAAP